MVTSEDGEVCWNESNEWRRCVEAHLLNKHVETTCAPQQRLFDECVARWRSATPNNAGRQIKGENPGDPPPQCQAHSCLVGECLRRTNYNFDACRPPMAFFKHCVKALYGSEFVV